MSIRIKIFFAFLAVFALFLVFSSFNSLTNRPGSVLSFANIGQSSLPPPEEDVDHDGLSNADEAYWGTDFKNPDTDGDGFLDGEETASNHDPNKAGPDDVLDNQNITDKISSLVAAGMAEGSLKPESPNYGKSLDDLALATMDDVLISLSPKIDIDKLILVASSEENSKKYISDASEIWRSLFSEIINSPEELELTINPDSTDENIYSYLLATSQKLDTLISGGLDTPVPENLVTGHLEFLNSMQNLSKIYNALASEDQDPIKAAAAFGAMNSSLEELGNIFKSFAELVKSKGMADAIFKN